MSAAGPEAERFRYEPDPDNPGWMTWVLRDASRFNAVFGRVIVRAEGAGQARVRMLPDRSHTNLLGSVHGAVVLGFMDLAMFAGARTLGVADAGGAVTLDCAAQFLAPARPGMALDALVEILRETGRLLFVRGLVVQGEERVAAWSGTLRKASPAR